MEHSWQRTATITEAGVVCILRTATGDAAVAAGNALVDGGLPVVEVSMTTPNALRAVGRLAEIDDGRLVGAGTVLDGATARLAIDAGARFLVSPTVSADVISCGNRYGAPVLAGAQTPTEALRALELGAALVKLFPADTFGPRYLSALRAALPQIGFVPTGGVDTENIEQWFAAGAVAVGVGSFLIGDSPAETRKRAADLRIRLDDIHRPHGRPATIRRA